MTSKKKIAVFASGFGSNLQAILDYQSASKPNGEVVLVFSNNKAAYALERAKRHKIKTACFSPSDFAGREEYDKQIVKMLDCEDIDLVVLAGYMLLLGKHVIECYRNRIINIHPALLPSFKGTHGIKDALEYGVKITGVTVHFVDEGLDSGPIIIQETVTVSQDETLESLEEKIHRVEHAIYPLAVDYFCSGRLKISGRKVIITT
ncbi:MAG: Phosphoribosylglycinamide formyltransferase [Actinobacteria bacterium ADurb.Bin346]|nr:MAG: Phosphoribosylglycinamide formyltransferase [Actinobacteria bacterium ADurb.Bin346]